MKRGNEKPKMIDYGGIAILAGCPLYAFELSCSLAACLPEDGGYTAEEIGLLGCLLAEDSMVNNFFSNSPARVVQSAELFCFMCGYRKKCGPFEKFVSVDSGSCKGKITLP